MVETTIISHLTGQLTPELMQTIQAPAVMAVLLPIVLSFVAIILVVWFFSWLIGMAFPKSTEYRKHMADMYIVGMVKKFAKEDGVNLTEELKAFAKIERKARLRERDIDSVIADNLKEKIEAKSDKEIDKIEG